jgi:penicillin-binding protein 1A
MDTKRLHPQTKKKIWFRSLIGCIFLLIVFAFRFTRNVLVGLPDVTKIKDMVFSQATVIEDRNGQTLYKLFDQNREYVDYSGISINMVNAIVALEDQRYREHNGLDPLGMVRAALNDLFHPGQNLQ